MSAGLPGRSGARTATAATLLVLVAILAPGALAHGYQASAEPAPNSRLLRAPDEVVIRMTEPVEVGETTVRVLDGNGTNVAAGPARGEDGATQSAVLVQAIEPTGDGVYTVAWKTLWLSDGHITEGAYAFVVGDAALPADVGVNRSSPAPAASEVLWRGLGFAGWIVAAGVLAYPALVAAPAWRGHPAAREADAVARRRAGRAALVAALAALAGALGMLLAQTLATGRGPGGVLDLAASTTVGKVLLARTLLALALLAAVVAVRARGRGHEWAALVALGGLATLTLASHARAADAHAPGASAADYVHLLAAAAWVGTLVALALTLRPHLRLLPAGERARVVAPLVARVSLVATLSVAALVATGAFAGFVHLDGEPARLLTTTYGRVLLAKLALVALLLGLGFVNRQVFAPAYRRAKGALPEGRLRIQRFHGLVAAEVALMALVLVATAALAGISPREEPIAAQQGLTLQAEGDAFLATLRLQPAAVGVNDIAIATADLDGARLEDATALTLVATALDRPDLPPIETVLEQVEPGRFEGQVAFGFGGEWLLTAKLQRSTAYDDHADFFVTIPA